MPVSPTYPGVYVQEIPSDVHTISGVSTSVTAFVGRAARGSVNVAVAINSFADFERMFGGLWADSRLGYAVRDFYLNGGGRAVIVRLFHPRSSKSNEIAQLDLHFKATPPANPSTPALGDNTVALPLQAVSPGTWGNYLRARIDNYIAQNVGQSYGLADADLFNLTVCDTQSGAIEVFRNVSLKPGARQVDKVLANQSQLVQVRLESDGTYAAITAPAKPPTAPKTKTDIWQDDTQSTGVATDQRVDDGLDLEEADFIGPGLEAKKQGLYALEQVAPFNLLCLPPLNATTDIPQSVWQAAAEYCEKRRAMLIIDPPASWADKASVVTAMNQSSLGVTSGNAMLYFPRLIQSDLLRGNQLDQFVPCGAVAGVIARTDAQRGVWKAPAGLEAILNGVAQLSVPLTDSENGELNPLGVNCLRTFPAAGQVVWGARTLRGDDRLASEWKYIPVRRLALFIEESLYRGTQWAVFEPNDEPLWAQLRLSIGAFLHDLFRQGAFQGQKPQDAYFVRCDSTTTLQNDIDRGLVNVIVGFAPLKPAEFVILSIQQMAGQIAV